MSGVYPDWVRDPQIRLIGEIDRQSVWHFLDGIDQAVTGDGDVAIEVTTVGGDASMGRRLVLEIDLARKRLKGRRLVFIGKTQVYSAGATIMSAFPREDRYLTADAMFMVHCQQLDKTEEISGPMRASLPKIDALAEQLRVGIGIENDNFRRLIQGSNVEFDEICAKAVHNWYFTAQEALDRRLIAAVL